MRGLQQYPMIVQYLISSATVCNSSHQNGTFPIPPSAAHWRKHPFLPTAPKARSDQLPCSDHSLYLARRRNAPAHPEIYLWLPGSISNLCDPSHHYAYSGNQRPPVQRLACAFGPGPRGDSTICEKRARILFYCISSHMAGVILPFSWLFRYR